MRTIICSIFIATLVHAAEPRLASSTISIGAGAATASAGGFSLGYHTGPSFSGEYEFGLHKHIAATIGVENYWMNVDRCSPAACGPAGQRHTLMPFGLRGIIPVAGGRVEAFAGTGGARFWSTDSILGGTYGATKVLWHVNAGFRVALDRSGHFRLGPVVRHNRDLARATQVWTSVTGELSYRFGR